MVDPLPRLRKTLRDHYRKKREHYGLDHPDFYESDLRKLFSDAPEYQKHQSAARFVGRVRKEVRGTVASFTDSYQYTIDQLLERNHQALQGTEPPTDRLGRSHQDGLHGLSHGPDDELPS